MVRGHRAVFQVAGRVDRGARLTVAALCSSWKRGLQLERLCRLPVVSAARSQVAQRRAVVAVVAEGGAAVFCVMDDVVFTPIVLVLVRERSQHRCGHVCFCRGGNQLQLHQHNTK